MIRIFRDQREPARRSLLRSEPDCSKSIDPFLKSLAQTVAWSGHRADAANPRESLHDIHHRPRTLETSYFAAVGTVLTGPRKWGKAATYDRAVGLAGGRLLVYFPDADLCDGAAEVESGGFFDVFNAPPWDTWVAFAADRADGTRWDSNSYANYLIAYVPPVFLEKCAAGIMVNPEGCIAWLEDTEVAFKDLLRQHAPELLWNAHTR